jgi:hypothetical protein
MEIPEDYIGYTCSVIKKHFEGPFCQSCGLPMKCEGDFGTEEDGSPSAEYCRSCYWKGEFVMPTLTLEEMKDMCAERMAETGFVTYEDACDMMSRLLPTLKRWRLNDI